MLGYIVVIVGMALWYWLCHKTKDTDHKKFLFGAAVLMTLFYGLRGINTGSDTISYVSMFYEDAAQPFSRLWEYMWEKKSPAYVLSEWLFYKIFPSAQLWFVATSAFFFFIFSDFIRKNSMDPFFSYFIFFTIFGTFQMTGIRQSCAMAVLMLAFEQMKNKKLFKFLLLIGLAYLFHKSAVVFLPFYFVGKRRITQLDIPVLSVALIAIYRNRSFLFDYIKSFTSYDYFEQLNHGEPINFSIMIYATTVLAIVLSIVLIVKKRKEVLEPYRSNFQPRLGPNGHNQSAIRYVPENLIRDEVYRNKEIMVYCEYANAMILASLFMPLVAINGAVRRIVMYFALFMVLLIPKAFREFIDGQLRNIVKIAFGAVLLYLLLSGVYGSSYSYDVFF